MALKRCPACSRVFDDVGLKFCLDDGTELISTTAESEAQPTAVISGSEAELPETIVVSVSHRPAIEQHHNVHLRLLGGGEWRVEPVGATPSPA